MTPPSNSDDDHRWGVRAALVVEARQVLKRLAPNERDSFEGLVSTLVNKAIPKHHEAKLVDLSLVERKLGRLILTPLGEAAISLIRSQL